MMLAEPFKVASHVSQLFRLAGCKSRQVTCCGLPPLVGGTSSGKPSVVAHGGTSGSQARQGFKWIRARCDASSPANHAFWITPPSTPQRVQLHQRLPHALQLRSLEEPVCAAAIGGSHGVWPCSLGSSGCLLFMHPKALIARSTHPVHPPPW